MEPPTLQNRMEEFLKSITHPEVLSTFEPIDFKVYYKNEELVLPPLYGFLSVYDLKLAIYELFDEDYAAPNNQFMYIDNVIPNINKFVLDFTWNLSENGRLEKPDVAFSVETPVNNEFVSSDGEKRIVDINPYENLLLSSRIKPSYKIHLLFVKDALEKYRGTKPLSEKEFNGRFFPYFPLLKANKVYPDELDKKNLNDRLVLFQKNLQFMNKITKLLENNYDILLPTKFAGFRYLSLKWPMKLLKENIDILFYKIPVNERRPYIRLLPMSTTPISKIHLIDVENNIPNIYQPQLLKQWTDEINPNEKDSLFFKIAIKTNILNIPFIYVTTYLSNNNFFEVILNPPKDVRKIDLEYDAPNLGNEILEGISVINTKNEIPELGKAKLIYGLNLPINKIVTKRHIERRIQLFKPFFQEIDPLPNEQPLIMLRYKLVDNYVNEDAISTFLTLLANKVSKGTIIDEVQAVSEEFQLDLKTSK